VNPLNIVRRIAQHVLLIAYALLLLIFPGIVATAGLGGLTIFWLAPLLLLSPLFRIVLVRRSYDSVLSIHLSFWSVAVFAFVVAGLAIGPRRPYLAGALFITAGIISAPLGLVLVLVGTVKIRNARMATAGTEWSRTPR